MPWMIGVLLAAGTGSRFGSDKSLHRLADGTPMAVASVRRLAAACDRCIAVLRPNQAELAALLAAEGVWVHFSETAAMGMGHSLAAAVHATAHARGWVVALADMPFIETTTITMVIGALNRGASIAAPTFEGRRGHPVGFSRQWFEALVQLEGDQGARALLTEHRHALTLLPCVDPGVMIDVDTPSAI